MELGIDTGLAFTERSLKAVWRVSSLQATVQFYPSFLHRLRGLSAAAAISQSDRRGLLLGRARSPNRVFTITDLHPFPVGRETHDGDSNLELARGLIARNKRGANQVSIVGSYKIDSQGDLSFLTEEDYLFMESLFHENNSIFLAISGTQADHTAARLIMRAGYALSSQTNRVFPLSTSFAPGRAHLAGLPGLPAGLASPGPFPVPPPQRFRSTRGWTIVMAILVASFTGFEAYRIGLQPARVSQAGISERRLGLLAEPQGSNLMVSWDTRGQAVTSADSGRLSITDGDVRRELELSRADLDAGRMILTPVATRVSLKLQVASGDRLTSEALIVVNRSAGLLPDAPPASIRPVQEAPGDARPLGPATSPSILPQLAVSGFVPAKILDSVSARLSPDQARLIVRETKVLVRVLVDSTGAVEHVEPASAGPALLTNLALDAARQFRFSPAQRNQQNVPSSVQVAFVFGPAPAH